MLNNNESLFFNDNNDLTQFNHLKKKDLADKTFRVSGKNNVFVRIDDSHFGYIKKDVFYKNYTKDTLIYNEAISFKKIILGEKINLFKWDIISKSDTLILGFKCQKAVTKFRGRIYEAFFSNKIAPYGGPWKFDGLPGLILAVKSKDNYVVIRPLKIILNHTIKIKNPYLKKKSFSWENFRSKYMKFFKRQIKSFQTKSDPGETGSIKITDRIEDLKIPEMHF